MKTAAITAFVNALVLALCLKGLHYFHLIKWHPIGFYKKWNWFEDSSKLFQWTFFIILLFIIGLFLYMTMRYVYIIPAVFSSLLLGLLVTITLEWIVLDLPLQLTSFKKLSIPFIVIVVCLLRFLLETANFHQKEMNAHRERT
ncbi:hypothetical protein U1P98_09465 [Lysinibacillus irui]|uniref:Uncharacterized protein n=1 Tax=Lysinibacillus irui TaxID=2998077 RepID=A0AAJ5RLV8_9BACI|nr:MULTISPECIES: hypothetical protein [Lysinibacillus]MEA0554803.1 hypothetical protein [Lysinibacillus irui]MEA0563725.1 hypothetical protein [Lysinibacillus irui]MEA0976518.1 hypothetical protein [Lysinibacillus irui]MEA1042672.1 hypothetical protein [Lysinibacillus irui]WDV05420.1 hypothetical protein OU989_13990 [Lysinibacillus irui]